MGIGGRAGGPLPLRAARESTLPGRARARPSAHSIGRARSVARQVGELGATHNQTTTAPPSPPDVTVAFRP